MCRGKPEKSFSMPEANLFRIFTDRLNKIGLRYFVTGSVASIVYGEPRLTHDVDLVLELGKNDAKKLVESFPLDEFYCPPMDIVLFEGARAQRGHFNLVHHETGFKADVYLMGNDQLHQWAMSNRRKVDIEGETVWLAPPEYVVLRKLQYYREGASEKHLRDIAGILSISADLIDSAELEQRISSSNLAHEWEKAKALLEDQT
jgi:hypothetical protein